MGTQWVHALVRVVLNMLTIQRIIDQNELQNFERLVTDVRRIHGAVYFIQEVFSITWDSHVIEEISWMKMREQLDSPWNHRTDLVDTYLYSF